ncbi:hypothetical protein EGW08_013483 [Elysia chlorotica]|uniref:Uncharacterized protein n=1 Tax=Elysia chlorotica TaxID=188477 RepID=A0A433TAZ9_ELYCH|nr:hypothetical protein EGW08_013483 [Elysia chlorotica]
MERIKKVSPKQSDTDGAVQQLPVSGASQVVAATRRSERQQNKVKMSSPNKEVWQNPKDVMKTHRIKRQSSTTKRDQAKTSSVTKSGVKSSSAVKSSALEEGRNQKFQNDSQSLKRKNPFICETSTQNTIKRRSILDSQLSVRTSADSDSHSERKEDLNNTNLPTTNESPSLSSKLIDILTEAENMHYIGYIVGGPQDTSDNFMCCHAQHGEITMTPVSVGHKEEEEVEEQQELRVKGNRFAG